MIIIIISSAGIICVNVYLRNQIEQLLRELNYTFDVQTLMVAVAMCRMTIVHSYTLEHYFRHILTILKI